MFPFIKVNSLTPVLVKIYKKVKNFICLLIYARGCLCDLVRAGYTRRLAFSAVTQPKDHHD